MFALSVHRRHLALIHSLYVGDVASLIIRQSFATTTTHKKQHRRKQQQQHESVSEQRRRKASVNIEVKEDEQEEGRDDESLCGGKMYFHSLDAIGNINGTRALGDEVVGEDRRVMLFVGETDEWLCRDKSADEMAGFSIAKLLWILGRMNELKASGSRGNRDSSGSSACSASRGNSGNSGGSSGSSYSSGSSASRGNSGGSSGSSDSSSSGSSASRGNTGSSSDSDTNISSGSIVLREAVYVDLLRRCSDLNSVDVVRLLQCLAYSAARRTNTGGANNKNAQQLVDMLLRRVATNIGEYHTEYITKIIYAVIKGSFKKKKFIQFMTTEVIERLDKFRAYQLHRILSAIWNSQHKQQDQFAELLAKQITKGCSGLSAEALSSFLPIFVELKLHRSTEYIAKLNVILSKRLRGWTCPELLVKAAYPAVLFDLLTFSNVLALIQGLMRHRLALQYPVCADVLSTDDRRSFQLSVSAINKHLIPLKIMQLCLKHDRPTIYSSLIGPPQLWLQNLESIKVQIFDPFDIPELPFVLADLLHIMHELNYQFHPSIYGPYLLEATDTLGKVLVEWDSNWTRYPPWRRFMQEDFSKRKHRYLRADGWTVVAIPLQTFEEMSTSEQRLEYVDKYLSEQGLEHLKYIR
eukprot:GHVS01056234.1.p1 GENE.GHVS01056234.1~~GHVS01056234.1.p1  ORF type:complete len:637 (+),score=125.67 GHVS01056234.1:175-2085(+)